VNEDDGHSEGDINALYAAVNDLPSDDPLRGGVGVQETTTALSGGGALESETKTANAKPGKGIAKAGLAGAKQGSGVQTQQQAQAASGQAAVGADAGGNRVTVQDAGQIRVPSLIGLPIRKVIEAAGAVGLEVNIHGNGTAREQAPAAGTMVVAGTQVVVRAGQ
jgi:cell division protein FtsI (penicillin-binding protein 3)